MAIHILDNTFSPYEWLSQFEHNLPLENIGASAHFIGTVRNHHLDRQVSCLTLEHYPDMTTRYLTQLEQQAKQKWPLDACLIIHRVGALMPGETIMLVSCWSAHRRAAIDACNWLVETLKFNAPFWKKEQTPEGEFWVEANTDGHG